MNKTYVTLGFVALLLAAFAFWFFTSKKGESKTDKEVGGGEQPSNPAATPNPPAPNSNPGTGNARSRQINLNRLLKAHQVVSNAYKTNGGGAFGAFFSPEKITKYNPQTYLNAKSISEDGAFGAASKALEQTLGMVGKTDSQIQEAFFRLRSRAADIFHAGLVPSFIDIKKMLSIPNEAIDWLNQRAYSESINNTSKLAGNLNRFDGFSLIQ